MRKSWGKLLILLLAATTFSCVTPKTSNFAYAAEVQETTIEEKDTDEVSEEVDEIEDEKEDKKTEKKKVSYKEKTLTIKKSGFVADTFNGVDAVYRPGYNDGSSATYSCAAFIKKYYKKVYDVSVYNLFGGSTPKSYEGKAFTSVKTPKVGDITYKSGHWSIVKKVNDNNTVTLIEQNWKWNGNQCKINRTVDTSSLKYFRLK